MGFLPSLGIMVVKLPIFFLSLQSKSSWSHQCASKSAQTIDLRSALRVTRIRQNDDSTQKLATHWLFYQIRRDLRVEGVTIRPTRSLNYARLQNECRDSFAFTIFVWLQNWADHFGNSFVKFAVIKEIHVSLDCYVLPTRSAISSSIRMWNHLKLA